MPIQQILDYVQKAHSEGKKRKDIHQGLIANGWTDLEADEAWEYFEQTLLPSLGQEIRKTSRSVFLFKLFVLAIALVALVLFILVVF